ncbi:MAG: toprim domain-containing protein [Mucilaginibacter sp.]
MKDYPYKISARWVKDNISIVDLLANLGFEPPKPVGKERRYISMLRDSDTTPSFSVDEKAGTWFDHGEGKGGNIIDFGKLYWNGLTFPEVLEKIVAVSQTFIPSEQRPFQRKVNEHSEPNYGILEIKDLEHNAALVNYLENRGIHSVAEGRTKEVYYYVEDENKIRTNFFAVGWQNETGSWEVRNAHFKGCLGHKAISFIPNSQRRLAVFEGYFNYLSWLTDNPFATESVLVLNSLALLQAGLTKANPFNDVYLFFDNDPSGQRATSAFRQGLPRAIDCSGIYIGYNDYNDKIVAERSSYQFSR